MSTGNTGEGFHWTNAYLSSALPWLTGSLATTTDPRRVDFPRVTKYVKVRATGADHRIGFTFNGITGSNYFTVDQDTTVEFDIRVTEMYVMAATGTAAVDIFAGLTLIPDRHGPQYLTGSTANDNDMGSGWQGVG